MYVALRNPGLGRRLAGRAHGLHAVRVPRYYRLGDDGLDWSSILTTGINDASSVAKVALQPVPSVHTILPGGGSQVIDYPVGTSASTMLGTSGVGLLGSSTGGSLFDSPLIWILGFGLIAFAMFSGGSRS